MPSDRLIEKMENRILGLERQLSQCKKTVQQFFESKETWGKPAISGSVINITEIVKIQKALKESEIKYRSILEHISVGVALISPKNGGT